MQSVIESISRGIKVSLLATETDLRRELVSRLSDSPDLVVIESTEKLVITEQKPLPDVAVIYAPNSIAKTIQKTCETLKRRDKSVQILVIVDHDEFDMVMDLIRAGATGIISSEQRNKLVEAIEDILEGGAPLPRKSSRRLVESFQRNLNSPLTSRETEVMVALTKGKSYKVIAQEMYVHPETVKSHLKNIYSKLEVRSKAQAIEVATREKLI